MDSSEEGSDVESPSLMSSRQQQNVKADKRMTSGTDLAMSENSFLKPKLDTIFAEVERSLPSIDFDLSDVSSDNEEPIIFHRHLKKSDYDYDDDKDLDTSLSGESLSELLPPFSDNLSLKSFTNDDTTTAQNPSFDNDMAFYMQQRNKTVTSKNTSWTDVVIEAEGDRPAPRIQNWIDPKEETEESTGQKGELNFESESIFSQTSLSDNEEKHEIESTSEKPKKASSVADVEINSGDRRLDKLVKKEELRNKERQIVDNVISSQAPRLIMPGLETVDLDTLLNTINEDNQFAPQTISNIAWPEHRNIEALFAAGEGNNRNEDTSQNTNQTLLERLARLSMRQSGEDLMDIDPITGAPRITDAEEKDVLQTMNNNNTAKAGNAAMATQQTAYKSAEQVNQSIMKNKSGSSTTSCGTNTADPTDQPRIITPSKYKVKPDLKPSTEPDTVFIDLRNFEKIKKEQQQKIERVQRILNIQPDSSSDDSSDSDSESVGLWFEQRQPMKRNMATKGVSAQALPDKPKLNRPSTVKPPRRVIPMNHRRNERGEDDSNRQTEAISNSENKEEEMIARRQAEEEEREKQRKIEEAREAERQSRLRLSKNLEAVRPTASVSGKQDAAENTPVIYDYDASYEPAPQTLPGILATDQESLLLTVHLSSNGEIILHRGKTNKSVDTGVGLSARYTVLLTCLLSLVPENFNFLHGKANTDQEDRPAMFVPPFYVLGLQQMWLDEHLCLVVAVTPVE